MRGPGMRKKSWKKALNWNSVVRMKCLLVMGALKQSHFPLVQPREEFNCNFNHEFYPVASYFSPCNKVSLQTAALLSQFNTQKEASELGRDEKIPSLLIFIELYWFSSRAFYTKKKLWKFQLVSLLPRNASTSSSSNFRQKPSSFLSLSLTPQLFTASTSNNDIELKIARLPFSSCCFRWGVKMLPGSIPHATQMQIPR